MMIENIAEYSYESYIEGVSILDSLRIRACLPHFLVEGIYYVTELPASIRIFKSAIGRGRDP